MNLKKAITVKLTAGLLIVTGLISPALAVSATVNNVYGLNLRDGASMDNAVLAAMPHGASVDVESNESNGWSKVTYNGVTGYAVTQYLAMESTLGTVTEGPLNVRSGPGSNYDKIGSLSAGASVEILSTTNGWHQITSGELSGYVSASYITTSGQSTAQSSKSYVRVTEGPLNVRSGPDTSYDKVTSLSTGSVVEVLGQENGWYQISQGYISSDYVCTATAEEASNSNLGSQIANYAKSFLGCRYVYGGTSPSGFDCSGFTYYVYKQFGYKINRTASNQLDNGRSVSRGELQPGDLVMFKKGGGSKRASHVGLYIGGNQFIHASTSSVGVIISDMNSSYYNTGFVGARRIV